MNLKLTEEQKLIQKTVREFCETEIKPIAGELEKSGEFPFDIIKKAGAINLLGMTVEQEHGGSGMDRISYVIALEELAKVNGGIALTLEAHNSLGVAHIYENGNDAQRERYFPGLVAGDQMAAWALTEHNAGSDASGTQTTAVLEGDEWVLNGTKTFITNARYADVVVVMAATDRSKGAKGISAFIVEKDTPGYTLGTDEDKLGLKTSVTSELFFDDCRIPKENIIGQEGNGFIGAMKILDRGRTAVGALAVGLAQAAVDESVKYAKEREQFGRPIGKFQAIQWLLAEMATKTEAARGLVQHAAFLEDAGRKFTTEASYAKLFAAQTGMWVTTQAIQIHGGYGYTKDYPVERFFRDVKLMEIGEGTNEVQRMVIARNILKTR